MGTGMMRLIGAACLLASLYLAQQSIALRRDDEVVKGKVVAVDEKVTLGNEGVTRSERAEIRYTPMGGGQSLILETGWSEGLFGTYEVGDDVAVRYLPEQPTEARKDSLFHDALGPLLLFVLGIAGILGRLQSENADTEITIWSDRRE